MSSRGHGLQISLLFTKCVLDSHMFLEQTSEFEWSEIDVPGAINDFFEANACTDPCNRDVNLLGVRANPTVGAPVARLASVGILR